jgi:predicted alpha/beta superfamily hydrolase
MIRVTKIQIPALPTEQPRRLYVYLPKDYEKTDTRYPVLYMFDGHNVFYDSHATYGKSWGMKEYLEKTKLPLILVAVECNPEGFRRLFEYSPWDFHAPKPIGDVEGLGKVTMDWFTTVLKPEIDRTYRTLPDREHTLIAGSSMGGLMSIYAVTAYNHVFSRAAALSPSLWVSPPKRKELIRTAPIAPGTRVYLDMGTEEIDKKRLALSGMFETAKELSRAGVDVAADVIPGAKHCEADWEKRIPVFLRYLF